MTAGGKPREESPDFIERDARCKPGRGDPTESATENRPPEMVRVKRWGKSPPAAGAIRLARKTPSEARPNRGASKLLAEPPGRPRRQIVIQKQNPAYSPARIWFLFGFVRVCSGLFGFVRVCPGLSGFVRVCLKV
jgi:hypothetical protein